MLIRRFAPAAIAIEALRASDVRDCIDVKFALIRRFAPAAIAVEALRASDVGMENLDFSKRAYPQVCTCGTCC